MATKTKLDLSTLESFLEKQVERSAQEDKAYALRNPSPKGESPRTLSVGQRGKLLRSSLSVTEQATILDLCIEAVLKAG